MYVSESDGMFSYIMVPEHRERECVCVCVCVRARDWVCDGVGL